MWIDICSVLRITTRNGGSIMTTTATTQRSKKDLLVILAITGVILLMFPLLALTGLALQLGFVVALPLALLALLLVPALARLRAPARKMEVQGIELPPDVYLHERHGWARPTAGGLTEVGADGLLLAAFSKVESVELPEPGTQVQQGEPLVTLRSGQRELTLKAPVSGTVRSTNNALEEQPSLLVTSPYRSGWMVKMELEAGMRSLDGMRPSATARFWLTHEIDRMLALLAGSDRTEVLADGGLLQPGFGDRLSSDQWRTISDELF